MFKPKDEGGLGIRDVGIMNVSLLRKWKWRIMTDDNAIWSKVLKHRYTNLVVKMFVNDKAVITKRDSIWWRDLILINDCAGSNDIYASNLFYCKVKIGTLLSFWFSKWTGNQAISESFPELYVKADNSFMLVPNAGFWEDGE